MVAYVLEGKISKAAYVLEKNQPKVAYVLEKYNSHLTKKYKKNILYFVLCSLIRTFAVKSLYV